MMRKGVDLSLRSMVLIILAAVAGFFFLTIFLPAIKGEGLKQSLITMVNAVTPGIADHIPNFF
ncbi:MAG: hypothetical protein ABEI97_00830 [Candidatus Nanohaloarchaea archaeon]